MPPCAAAALRSSEQRHSARDGGRSTGCQQMEDFVEVDLLTPKLPPVWPEGFWTEASFVNGPNTRHPGGALPLLGGDQTFL